MDFSALEPTVLDLFCGAGGLSLGFERAGYTVLAGVDSDEHAVKTFDVNHDGRGIQCDLTSMSPAAFCDRYDIQPDEVDVIVGGPPCQGFSEANLDREVDDDRNNLVFVFAEYVDHFQPTAFLMENVQGILTLDDGSVLTELLSVFRKMGYAAQYCELNAANYGVPQKRRRVFVQGHQNIGIAWPAQTHAPVDELYDMSVLEGVADD